MKTAALISAIALSLATAAVAEPAAGIATLAAAATTARISGEAGVWRCSGTSCAGAADTRTGLAVAACTDVASANGRVVGFTVGGQTFGEAELKRCNRHVK